MSAGGTSVGNTPSSFASNSGLLFIILGHFLSLVTGSSFLSAISDHFLSIFISGCLLFAISNYFLSLVADGSSLPTIANSKLLSIITDDGFLFDIFGDCSLFSVPLINS